MSVNSESVPWHGPSPCPRLWGEGAPRPARKREGAGWASLHQILGIYRGPERIVVGNEIGDELMKARLEYLLHPAVLQPGADGAGLTLRLSLAAIGSGDQVTKAHQVDVAARQRTRHLLVEDKEVGDEPRLEVVAVDPVIGRERRHRSQDRRPLIIIERAADTLVRRQQHVVLDVEDASGVIGALYVEAEPGKPVGVVAQHGAVGRSIEPQRGFLYPVQETQEFVPGWRTVAEAPEFEPGAVDGFPG